MKTVTSKFCNNSEEKQKTISLIKQKDNSKEHRNFTGQCFIKAKVTPGKNKQFAVKDSKQSIMCLVKMSLGFYWQMTEH